MADTQLALERLGLEHMHLEDLFAVLLAGVQVEGQVRVQAEVQGLGLGQPLVWEQPLVPDRPVGAFSAVPFAMTLVDSTRPSRL